MKLILQTRRLTLRELEKEDVGALRLILQDPLVMYAWEHAFTDAEIRGWIETNQARYQKDGCGYWAAQASETGKLIGMLGLLMEELDGERKLGLGYLLRRDCWGMGYATEVRRRCLTKLLQEECIRGNCGDPAGKHTFPPCGRAAGDAGGRRASQTLSRQGYAAFNLCKAIW